MSLSEEKTVQDHIRVYPDGRVLITLRKQIVKDNVVLTEALHYAVVEPITDVPVQIAVINNDLQRQGFPSMSTKDIEQFTTQTNIARTPEVVAAWKEKVAKEERERRKAVERDKG